MDASVRSPSHSQPSVRWAARQRTHSLADALAHNPHTHNAVPASSHPPSYPGLLSVDYSYQSRLLSIFAPSGLKTSANVSLGVCYCKCWDFRLLRSKRVCSINKKVTTILQVGSQSLICTPALGQSLPRNESQTQTATVKTCRGNHVVG
jgi:hypothetical protein